MICINCGHPADSLFVVYSGGHIRLTECANCHQTVDKYVEFDPVLLCIDLLLLKKGAYRHITFNKLELQLANHPNWNPCSASASCWEYGKHLIYNVKNWMTKYGQLNRLQLFLVAFDVYLAWVTAEIKFSKYYIDFEAMDQLMISHIFQGSIWMQYLHFFINVLLEMFLLHACFQYALIKRWRWGENISYRKDIIYYTIIVSYVAKIFPVLMLIWPYDTLLSTAIIKFMANIYIIESVHIVTEKSYFQISALLMLTLMLQGIIVQPLLMLITSKFQLQIMIGYLKSEYELLLFRMNAKKSLYL